MRSSHLLLVALLAGPSIAPHRRARVRSPRRHVRADGFGDGAPDLGIC